MITSSFSQSSFAAKVYWISINKINHENHNKRRITINLSSHENYNLLAFDPIVCFTDFV